MTPNAQREAASQGALAAKAEYKRQEIERTAAWQAHRASVEGDRPVPTYRVPVGRVRVRIRGACPFCGGSMFDVQMPPVDRDRPHVSLRGDVFCLLCGRKAAELAIGHGERPSAPPCADPPPAPKRGRPLPAAAAIKPPSPPCPACNGRRRAKTNRAYCQPCAANLNRGREDGYRRLLAALGSGWALRGREIAERIGTSTDRVRHLVHLARERGVPIVTEGKCYRLEARP